MKALWGLKLQVLDGATPKVLDLITRRRKVRCSAASHLVNVYRVVLLHAPSNDGPKALDRNLVVLILLRLLSEPVHVRLEQKSMHAAVSISARIIYCV